MISLSRWIGSRLYLRFEASRDGWYYRGENGERAHLWFFIGKYARDGVKDTLFSVVILWLHFDLGIKDKQS